MNAFGMTFLLCLCVASLLRLWLSSRHMHYIKAHRDQLPSAFEGQISLDAHQRAADYTCAKARLGQASTLLEVVIALGLTFGGGLDLLNLCASQVSEGMMQGLVLLLLTGLLMGLIELPFSWYSTFHIESRFGFNKMTPALFFKDLAKSLLLGIALGLPLASAILWLMEKMGSFWWFDAWLTWMGFNILMLALYPMWIAPLFNKFTPMDNPALKERIEALLHRCGFAVKGLMVMDGSIRSSHGNAYFTGFGKTKRIVFFDTLLERLKVEEVEAVLAHELGHFKCRHVVKRILLSFAASFFFLYLLGYVMDKPWFYSGLNVTTASTAMTLILFFLVTPHFTFLLQPLMSAYSRQHEFEADQYAAAHANPADLVNALTKLYNDNASTLTPDPLHSMFYDSHPPALIRIGKLQPNTPLS